MQKPMISKINTKKLLIITYYLRVALYLYRNYPLKHIAFPTKSEVHIKTSPPTPLLTKERGDKA